MSSTPALELVNLSKNFGRVKAVDGLSLRVPDKSVTAFVGANGAGKTTTFSLIGQFIKPSAGHISVFGKDISEYRFTGGAIGLLPQDMQYFEDRSVARQLELFARLGGMDPSDAKIEVGRVLQLTKLLEKADAKAGELSHGMRVRLGVAQALIGNPPLVLLDEPTAGLDPRMQAEFRQVVEAVRGRTTLLISSHNLTELQELCDYCCMVDKGRLVKQGPMSEMLASGSITLRILATKLPENLEALKELLPGIEMRLETDSALLLRLPRGQTEVAGINAKLLPWLLGKGVGVLEVRELKSLETTFLEATSVSRN
jgi:ABC-2 type transport system ATP-binding protein